FPPPPPEQAFSVSITAVATAKKEIFFINFYLLRFFLYFTAGDTFFQHHFTFVSSALRQSRYTRQSKNLIPLVSGSTKTLTRYAFPWITVGYFV
uniref:hypothetical protein n=1 Tax=Enterocloster clostridioformis TaxID=1531 RepID=UPI003FA4187E